MGNQTLDADFLQTQFNSEISNEKAEAVLDGAINLLNTFLTTALDNLSGVAESKTGTYTSAQAGAIMAVALVIYRENYINAQGATSSTVGQIGTGYSASKDLADLAKTLADALDKEEASGDPPIWVSNDPLPTS